jgi:hypothetical protein
MAAAIVLAVWAGALLLLAFGRTPTLAALVNLLLSRYFFVRMRWRGVSRGMGAPGFMTYWAGAAVFLLESTRQYAPGLEQLALLVIQVDFAFIMLSAGVYKLRAGYAHNDGMDLGMVNPMWGYLPDLFRRVRPGHPIFRFLNHMAWFLEILAGLLMLLPPTRFLGALIIAGSFVFVGSQIRLGLLAELVVLCTLVFFHPGSLGDFAIRWLVPGAGAALPAATPVEWVSWVLGTFLVIYLALLPLAHLGLSLNLYASRRLPEPLQRALEAWTNFFGIIVWRVFSADLLNFFVRIRREPAGGGGGVLVSDYGWTRGLRYGHVCESITVTSLFTTLKYFPGDDRLFQERLLRYARSVPCAEGSVLIFEYVSIQRTPERYEYVPVCEFRVDPHAGGIEERILSDVITLRQPARHSPIHAGSRPGSYAPSPG